MAIAGKTGASGGVMVPSGEENPLLGAIDMHIHTGPDCFPRALNVIEIARKAKDAGMRGFVCITHQFVTHDRAYLARQVVPGIEVFGGIVLGWEIGGINPSAVETALKFSGDCMKFVKLPTLSKSRGGLHIWDSSEEVLPDFRKILKMVTKADIAMLTGQYPRGEFWRL